MSPHLTGHTAWLWAQKCRHSVRLSTCPARSSDQQSVAPDWALGHTAWLWAQNAARPVPEPTWMPYLQPPANA